MLTKIHPGYVKIIEFVATIIAIACFMLSIFLEPLHDLWSSTAHSSWAGKLSSFGKSAYKHRVSQQNQPN